MIASVSQCDPTISVVIPCLNRVSLLKRSLKSVLAQSFQPQEIIVVDDGSSPPLQNSLAEEFPSVSWFWQRNSGVSSARNYGIRKARHEFIALLDSDDEWEPTKLEKQIDFHKANPQILASHTAEKWIRHGNHVLAPKYMNKDSHHLFERSLERCLICPSSVFLHRSLFKTIGYFNENLPVCEDYDLWLRLLAFLNFGFLEETLVKKHGGHADQLSTRYWGMDRYRVISLENLIKVPNLSSAKKEQAIRTIIKKYQILAKGFEQNGKKKQSKLYTQKSLSFEKNLNAKTRSFTS